VNRYALSFTVKPGSEPEVAEILRGYRRPPAGAAGGAPPLLRRTSVFMAGQRVVRVMDVAGDIGAVMRHLAAQPQIRAVEEALDPYLSAPRDLRSTAGVQAFLHHALLPLASHRDGPAGQQLRGAGGRRSAVLGESRCGLLYPVRAGRGERAVRLLYDGVPALTTTFRRGDLVVGMLEVDGSVSDTLDHLARAAARDSAESLAEVLDTTADLTTEAGRRGFFESCQMELLTDRRVGVPA
jgi:hypothetical protein